MLALAAESNAAPVNDSWDARLPLGTGVPSGGTTGEATIEAGETIPEPFNTATWAGTVWWEWTAPAAGGWHELRVAGVRGAAAVRTGTMNGPVAGATRIGADQQARIWFQADPGEVYQICVASETAATAGPVDVVVVPSVPALRAVSFSLDTSTADVTGRIAPVNVQAEFQLETRATLIGGTLVMRPAGAWARPSGSQPKAARSVRFHRRELISQSGDISTWKVTIPLTEDAPAGSWQAVVIPRTSEGETLPSIGSGQSIPWPARASAVVSVTNTGTGDTAGPRVSSFDVSRTSVWVVSSQSLTVSVSLWDDTGVDHVDMELHHPALGAVRRFRALPDQIDSFLRFEFPLPARSLPEGAWRVRLIARDLLQNESSFFADEPGAPGSFRSTITIFHGTGPSLTDWQWAGTMPMAPSGPANQVDAEFAFTASASGQAPTHVTLGVPDAAGLSFSQRVPFTLLSGTSLNGRGRARFSLPGGFPPGTWPILVTLHSPSADSMRGVSNQPLPAGSDTTLQILPVAVTLPRLTSLAVTSPRLSALEPSTTGIAASLTAFPDGLSNVEITPGWSRSPLSLTPSGGNWVGTLAAPQSAAPGEYALGVSGLSASGRRGLMRWSNEPGFPGAFSGTLSLENHGVPTVASCAFSPDTVSTQSGDTLTTARLRIIAPGGFLRGWLHLINHRELVGEQLFGITESHRISGTPEDGIYEVPAALPAGVWPGTIYPYLTVEQNGPELALWTAPGMPGIAPLAIVNPAYDLTPPVVHRIDIAPAAVDTADGNKTVEVTIHATDDISGVDSLSVYAWFSSGTELKAIHRVSGDDRNGIWRGELTIFQDTPSVSSPVFVWAIDRSWRPAIAQSGIPGVAGTPRLEINRPDAILHEFHCTPGSVDISGGDQQVALTIRAACPAYFAGADIELHGNDRRIRLGTLTNFQRTAGTSLDGTWSGTFAVPRGTPAGDYQTAVIIRQQRGRPTVFGILIPFFEGWLGTVPLQFTDRLAVANTAPDRVPPSINLLSATSSLTLPILGSVTAEVRFRITDEGSGPGIAKVSTSEEREVQRDADSPPGEATYTAYVPLWTPGTWNLRIEGYDRAGLSSSLTVPVVVATLPAPFEAWMAAAGLPGAQPDADADGDGISNLLEFALMLNPVTPSRHEASADHAAAGGLPAARLNSNRGLTLTWWAPRYPVSQKLSYQPQFSSDGVTWSSATAEELETAGDLVRLEATDSIGLTARQKRFGRLRVTMLP